MTHEGTNAVTCDMDKTCIAPISHIDEKGFVYCRHHGRERNSYRRSRAMQPWEVALIKRGLPLPSYERITKEAGYAKLKQLGYAA